MRVLIDLCNINIILAYRTITKANAYMSYSQNRLQYFEAKTIIQAYGGCLVVKKEHVLNGDTCGNHRQNKES